MFFVKRPHSLSFGFSWQFCGYSSKSIPTFSSSSSVSKFYFVTYVLCLFVCVPVCWNTTGFMLGLSRHIASYPPNWQTDWHPRCPAPPPAWTSESFQPSGKVMSPGQEFCEEWRDWCQVLSCMLNCHLCVKVFWALQQIPQRSAAQHIKHPASVSGSHFCVIIDNISI